MVSDKAVAAAAEAVYGCGFDGSPQREAWLRDFRIALEAAAPYLVREAPRTVDIDGLFEGSAILDSEGMAWQFLGSLGWRKAGQDCSRNEHPQTPVTILYSAP